MNGWKNVDKPFELYPIGTKARQSWSGGYWIKVLRGWKWCTGDTFLKPGCANQIMLPEES